MATITIETQSELREFIANCFFAMYDEELLKRKAKNLDEMKIQTMFQKLWKEAENTKSPSQPFFKDIDDRVDGIFGKLERASEDERKHFLEKLTLIGPNTLLRIQGELSQDISRTFNGLSTYERVSSLATGGRSSGLFSILSGALRVISGEVSGIFEATQGSINRNASGTADAHSEAAYYALPYADEVKLLWEIGFRAIRNNKEFVTITYNTA